MGSGARKLSWALWLWTEDRLGEAQGLWEMKELEVKGMGGRLDAEIPCIPSTCHPQRTGQKLLRVM